MKVMLIRHAESYANINNDLYSQVPDHEIDITPKGVEQANDFCLEHNLKSYDRILVLCSPYKRTLKTRDIIIEPIKDLYNITSRIEPILHERLLASNYEELKEVNNHYYREKSFGLWWYKDGGVESYNDVYQRALLFKQQLNSIKQSQKYDQVVIISHCVFLSMLRCIIEENTDIDYMSRIPHFTSNCSSFDCEL